MKWTIPQQQTTDIATSSHHIAQMKYRKRLPPKSYSVLMRLTATLIKVVAPIGNVPVYMLCTG